MTHCVPLRNSSQNGLRTHHLYQSSTASWLLQALQVMLSSRAGAQPDRAGVATALAPQHAQPCKAPGGAAGPGQATTRTTRARVSLAPRRPRSWRARPRQCRRRGRGLPGCPGRGPWTRRAPASLDAPGPRLLDGYDTDPGGADTERRARRRALRRSIARGASALLALVASSGCCLSLPPIREDMTVAHKDAAILYITSDRPSWMYDVSCHEGISRLQITPDLSSAYLATSNQSTVRSAGGHSALRAASSLMDSLCKALGDMPNDVERAAAFGDHWGSDGFDVSGLEPTESEPDRAGCSMAAQGSAARSSR